MPNFFKVASQALCGGRSVTHKVFGLAARTLTMPAAHIILGSASLAENAAIFLSHSRRPNKHTNAAGLVGLVAGASTATYGYIALAKLALHTLAR